MSHILFCRGNMSIVRWKTDNVDVSQIEADGEVTLALLKMDPKQLEDRWEGKLIIKPRGIPRGSVELRKLIGVTNILIKIYDDDVRTKENRLVHMSMNSSVSLTENDLNIMKLAINEGIKVYRLPDHWIKLNKYLEESKGRQQRRTDGKFVKVKI